MRRTLVVATCIALASFPVFSAHTPLSLSAAKGLLADGKLEIAYDALILDHTKNSENPQEWFLLGVAAKKLGKLDEAKGYFLRVLELAPDSARVNLELAEISFRQGDEGTAKQLLLDVKAGNPPASVDATIDRFLATIESGGAKRKPWRLSASLGWMYDSNANAGPNTETVTLFDLPFVLSSTARESSDDALVARLGFDYVKPINETLNWQSNASLSWTDYSSINTLDALVLRGSTGATWRQNQNMIWSLPVVADWTKIGHTNSYYSYSLGVAPQLRYVVNQELSTNVGVSVSKKKYQSGGNRDMTAWSISPSIDYRVSEAGSMRVGFSGSQERSGVGTFSNDVWGMNASYFHSFNKDFVLTLRTGYSDAQYQEKESAQPGKRHDKTSRFGVDLAYQLKSIDAELFGSLNYTNNDSNLELYEYDRSQVSLSIRKTF